MAKITCLATSSFALFNRFCLDNEIKQGEMDGAGSMIVCSLLHKVDQLKCVIESWSPPNRVSLVAVLPSLYLPQ